MRLIPHFGLDTNHPCEASRIAIRSRHAQAIIEHESRRARGHQPNIYTLDLETPSLMQISYTLGSQEAVSRGYGWETNVNRWMILTAAAFILITIDHFPRRK